EKTDLKFTISKDREVFVSRGEKMVVAFTPDYLLQTSKSGSGAAVEDEFVRNRRYTVGVKGPGKEAKISGQILSLENQKPIDGAIVFEKKSQRQTISGRDGRYEITLPKGNQTLLIQNIGGYTEQRLLDI